MPTIERIAEVRGITVEEARKLVSEGARKASRENNYFKNLSKEEMKKIASKGGKTKRK